MDRSCFDSLKPKEISRDQLKILLKGGEIKVYEIFKLVGFVKSIREFKDLVKSNGLGIENGHLNFEKVNLNTVITEKNFTEDILLLKKGKTRVSAIRL